MDLTPSEIAEARAKHSAQVKSRIASQKSPTKKTAPPPRMAEDRLKKAGQLFNRHVAVVKDEDFEAALVNLNYLMHVANRLTRGDEIEMVNDSFTRVAICRVIGIDQHGFRVDLHVMSDTTLPPSRLSYSDPDDLFEIVNGGLQEGWKVVRKADGVVLKAGLRDADAALQERRYQHSLNAGRA